MPPRSLTGGREGTRQRVTMPGGCGLGGPRGRWTP
jgi:hypothetical protein